MLKTLGLAFAVLAGLLILAGSGLAVWTLLFLNRSEVATGTVIRLADEGPADTRSFARMTRPIVRFTTATGATLEIAHAFATSPPAYAVGDQVTVRYAHADPTNARIDSPFSRWFVPGLIGGIGTIFAVVSVVLLAIFGAHTSARADLVAHGVRWQGQVVAVDRQYFTKGGDKRMLHSVTVDAADPATGVRRRFTRKGFRAGDVDHFKPGDPMTVIVDRRDPAHFAFDIPEYATQ